MEKRMRKGMARVEFRAARETIEDMLEKGYNYRLIYEFLFENGKITMSYRSFWQYIKTELNQPTKTESTPASKNIQSQGQGGHRFHHDPVPDKNRLI